MPWLTLGALSPRLGRPSPIHRTGASAVHRRRFIPSTTSKDLETSLGLLAVENSHQMPTSDCSALVDKDKTLDFLDYALGSDGDMEAVLVTYSWKAATTDLAKQWGDAFRRRYAEHPTVDAYHLIFRTTWIELAMRSMCPLLYLCDRARSHDFCCACTSCAHHHHHHRHHFLCHPTSTLLRRRLPVPERFGQ